MRTFILISIVLIFSNSVQSQTAIKAQDNTLFIQYQGKADSIFFNEKSGEKIKLAQASDGLWKATLQIEDINLLILQYKLSIFNSGEAQPSDYQLWLGEQLPGLHKKKAEVSGQIIEDSIWSEALEAHRKLSIYLPEHYNASKTYPIIYLADGKIVQKYAAYVEQLIAEKKVTDLILIGIHSGVTPEKDKFDMAKNKRTLEYLKGIGKFIPTADLSRYDKHLSFFCEEVIAYVKNHYAEDTQQRSLFGFSNGASFSVSASLDYPNLYANVIALSIGWDLAFEDANIPEHFPDFYMAAGSLEKDFYATTQKWSKLLEKADKKVSFKKVISYHDDVMWREQFLSIIQNIYKP